MCHQWLYKIIKRLSVLGRFHKTNKYKKYQPSDKPACKLNELHFVSAPQQSLSVLQQDGGTDKELEGEVRVDGLLL